MASPSSSPNAQQPDKHENGEQDHRSAEEIFHELVPTLPKETLSTNGISHYQYQGFWYSEYLLKGVIWAQKHLKAQHNDTFLASFRKCGTTWLKALAFATLNRNQYDDSNNPLLTQNPHVCVPFMVSLVNQDILPDHNQTPRLLSSHIPYDSLPKSIVNSGSKIVYICRNPKDVFVSYYHFMSKVRSFENQWQIMEEMFDFFCRGISIPGPFWEHVLGYWNASLERPDKVLFLKYEDMKADTEGVVKKMAEFVGHPFSPEEESNGAVRKVVKLCSFETLSNLEVNKTGEFRSGGLKLANHAFFRKGKVGDFRNLLTDDMIKRLDEITEQKFAGTGLKL